MKKYIKTQSEIKCITTSLRIAERVMKDIKKELAPGVTEKQISRKIWHLMKYRGAKRKAFHTIVAFGPSGKETHHTTTSRKLRARDLIIIDIGCRYRGYCSDITRTFCLKPGKRERKIYSLVKNAQQRAIKMIKPGMPCKDIDNTSRRMISKAGYGKKKFPHGLGHGVGKKIHENPKISPKSKHHLQAGMVITIEPGIYLNWGGVRLEDMILVTKNNYKNLTTFPKKLTI